MEFVQNMRGHSKVRFSFASSPVWTGMQAMIYFVLQVRCLTFWPTAPKFASFLARAQKVTASPKLSAPIGRWISKFALLDGWRVSSLNFQNIPSNGNKEFAKAHCFSGKAPFNSYSVSSSPPPPPTKCFRAGQARDDVMQRMRFGYSITNATHAPSAYAIPTTFPRQQWLWSKIPRNSPRRKTKVEDAHKSQTMPNGT